MLADTHRPGGEASSHAEQCPACKEFLQHSLDMERQLEAALRVPMPQGLSARLLDRMAAARRPRWLAFAGIDFVVFEEAQAIADAKPADMKVLAAVARNMGVALPGRLGEIYCI